MITTNCDCSRVSTPSGIWEYYQLLGAKVKIKSLPVSNFFKTVGREGTISNISFRITLDGKTVTTFELAEYPRKFFTSKDFEVIELTNAIIVYPICGTFVCGKAICGLNVDKSPSYVDNVEGGISIIDENGNIITSRKIKFIGATVEDITTDDDDITDVSIDQLERINGGSF